MEACFKDCKGDRAGGMMFGGERIVPALEARCAAVTPPLSLPRTCSRSLRRVRHPLRHVLGAARAPCSQLQRPARRLRAEPAQRVAPHQWLRRPVSRRLGRGTSSLAHPLERPNAGRAGERAVTAAILRDVGAARPSRAHEDAVRRAAVVAVQAGEDGGRREEPLAHRSLAPSGSGGGWPFPSGGADTMTCWPAPEATETLSDWTRVQRERGARPHAPRGPASAVGVRTHRNR